MKPIVPIFFAADENYLPYLAVSLKSIYENASRGYKYEIHVLNSGISEESADRILKLAAEDFDISFDNVSDKLKTLFGKLHIRDYYTCTTYYRIFIADMFPQYDKALYIDSDTVILGDISELYGHDIGDNLVGAIADETVMDVQAFSTYVEYALGIRPEKYFNAGILVMNLKKFREEDFYTSFTELLGLYRFSVAQDQDYLNVLCKDRVFPISSEWNKMPIKTDYLTSPKLIHYNLTRKPWHYSDILYEEHFWHYAGMTEFYGEIMNTRELFDEENAKKDAECERKLVALAASEADNPSNYFNTYARR